MRLLWLADTLRAAGLTVHEYDGWRTRGADTFGPVRGVVCHGTAGSLTSTDAGELRVIAITGSTSAPEVPIAQLYLSRTGAWWVVASGTATGVRTGTAGPLAGYSDDAVLQIEAQHASTEPWSEAQYRSYVRGVAALVAHTEPGYDVPVSRVVGHYEHQPENKTDPWFDMNIFRREVAAFLSGDDMSWEETFTLTIDGRPVTALAKNWLMGANDAAWKTFFLVKATSAADETRDAATLAAVKALAESGGVEAAPIVAAIKAEAETTRALVEQRHREEMAALKRDHDAELAGLRAELDALTTPNV